MENEETPEDDEKTHANIGFQLKSILTLPSYGKAMKKTVEPISTLCKAREQESHLCEAAEHITNIFNDSDAVPSSNELLVRL